VSLEAAIARAVAGRVAAEHAALERAAEAALQAGDRGVLALTDLAGAVLSASADERVPYGQLWYVPGSLDVDELVRLRRLALRCDACTQRDCSGNPARCAGDPCPCPHPPLEHDA
jgi:hypothetical protein